MIVNSSLSIKKRISTEVFLFLWISFCYAVVTIGLPLALTSEVAIVMLATYLASRPARIAAILELTTSSPLRPKMFWIAFSNSANSISK